jgi:hypothetical protein
MIGKPEWFKYRIFGWGISPKTWQGWIYVAVIAALIGVTLSITMTNTIRGWVFGVILALVLLDVGHIMIKLPKVHDERENMHQLIIERNCSFAAIVGLIGVAAFESIQNRSELMANPGMFPFDVSIAVVLGVMLITKIVSTLYVRYAM